MIKRGESRRINIPFVASEIFKFETGLILNLKIKRSKIFFMQDLHLKRET